ncbi:unnamed protein product, partial [marine sediment metagenome]
DTFNFLEHFFAMMSGILMCTAALYESYRNVLKGKAIKLNIKKVER